MDEQRYDEFVVMKNEEIGRYAIWPAGDKLPRGWTSTGFTGDQEACREYIREHWPEVVEWEDEEDDWDSDS